MAQHKPGYVSAAAAEQMVNLIVEALPWRHWVTGPWQTGGHLDLVLGKEAGAGLLESSARKLYHAVGLGGEKGQGPQPGEHERAA